MALLLRRKGVQKIRPLAGGLEGWRTMGYPLTLFGLASNQRPPAAEAKLVAAPRIDPQLNPDGVSRKGNP